MVPSSLCNALPLLTQASDDVEILPMETGLLEEVKSNTTELLFLLGLIFDALLKSNWREVGVSMSKIIKWNAA